MCLRQSGQNKTLTDHRLVAQEFIQKPNNEGCVDRNDRNTTKNVVNNLRLVSVADN